MIENMKFMNVMGPVEDMDRVIENYLQRYDIHLEYTTKELPYEKGLSSFSSQNPYLSFLRKAEKLLKIGDMQYAYGDNPQKISTQDAINTINFASEHIETATNHLKDLQERQSRLQHVLEQIEPFADLMFQVEDLSSFEFITYQFGKMPISGFMQFETFLYKDPQILFVQGRNDGEYLYGVYFTEDFAKMRVDSLFASLHFEKMSFVTSFEEKNLIGTPKEVCEQLSQMLDETTKTIEAEQLKILNEVDSDTMIDITKKNICDAYHQILHVSHCFDMRKYAAKTANQFYIMVGWMTESSATALSSELEKDEKVVFIIEENNSSINSKPPTKLKNNALFKPFEFFVKMYGLPSYNEMDPTPFVAFVYTILFGVMFADLGQGALLALLGLLLSRKKGNPLGKVLVVIGCSSLLFGAIFGSVFGYEFHSLLQPTATVNINTTLVVAIAFGVLLILTAMSFHVYNAIAQKKVLEMLFSQNGLSGILFYISALAIGYFTVLGNVKVAFWMVLLFLVTPMLLMAFREPLIRHIRNAPRKHNTNTFFFLFETLIELFEIVLSFFSNTLSFVRVGAFVLSHASMMGVVWMLSRSANGTNNFLVIILGNLLVIALEGLIVGIQVLRLAFYEMFSRFYEGSGREFVPYSTPQKLKPQAEKNRKKPLASNKIGREAL